jgi:polysaccharide pyruvyl transferase WcaK-like protein
MRILHTYCLNYNLGDYALGIGVKNLLREYLDVDLIAETNLQGTVFNEYFIDVINKNYDLLVIGGGGIIHGAHWPNGWFWLIDRENIRKIKIPFIVYGVGYNYFRDEQGIPAHGIEHLRETLANAAYFSVRNDGSYERLKDQTGIDVPEIPDPGFFVHLNTRYERPEKEPYVILQLANDKPEYRFGKGDQRSRFVDNIRAVVSNIAQRYKVVLAPHVLADVGLSHQVAEGLDNTVVWNFGDYAFDHADKSVAWYQYAEYVLAMRGHGQIVPLCFNVPVISLENHPKHRGLMEKLGLGAYNVSVDDPAFVEKCIELVNKIEGDGDDLWQQLPAINQRLAAATKAAFEQIKERISFITC